MDRRVCRFVPVCLLAALLTLAVSAAAMARTWTDAQGRKIQAKFVRVHEGKVILDRGGKVLSVSYFRLSEEDQEYVRKQLEAKGQGHLIPTVDPQAQAEDANGQNPGMNVAAPGAASPMPVPVSPMPSFSGFPMPGLSPQPSPVPRMPSGQSSPSSPAPTMPGSMPTPYSPTPPYGSAGSTPMPPPMTSPPPMPPTYSPPYSPPSPSMPSTSSFPSPQMPRLPFSTSGSSGAEQYECGNCKKTVVNARIGQKCPHCGVLWEYEDLGNGQVKDASGKVRSRASIETVGIGGGIIVAVAGLVWFLRWLAKSLS